MKKTLTLLALSAILTATGMAYAGEPTGRFQGAQGAAPQGAESVYFAAFANGTNTHYMPADGASIPQGSVPAATIASGTKTHSSPADTEGIAVGVAAQSGVKLSGGDEPEQTVQPA